MAEPTVHPVTHRWWDTLPEAYRAADPAQVPDYPLLRYLSLLGDQLGEVTDLLERVDFVPLDEDGTAGDTSDLADPGAADAAWLPWLAQFLGVDVSGLTVPGTREAIANAATGFHVATKPAMAAAAASVLIGDRFVQVFDHTISTPGDGSQWDVLITTRPLETPDASLVIPAVIALGAKPAGVTLHHEMYVADWAHMVSVHGPDWTAFESDFPTWHDAAIHSPE